MAKHIKIAERDIPIMRELYLNKKKEIMESLRGIDEILKQLDEEDRQFSSQVVSANLPIKIQESPIDSNPDINYPKSGKWIDKCKFLLSSVGPMNVTQILEAIFKFEPEKEEKRKQVLPTVSGLLSDLARNNKEGITREKSGGEYVYHFNKQATNESN